MTCTTTLFSSLSTMAITLLKLLPTLFLFFSCLIILRLILLKTGLIFTFNKYWRSIQDFFHVCQFIKVPQFNQHQQNQLYNKVHVYLTNLASTQDTDFINLFTGKNSNDVVVDLDPDENVVVEDNFLGARVYWISKANKRGRCFMLKVRKSDKKRILRTYLQHIHDIYDESEARRRELRLYMNSITDDKWLSIPFKHAATFETIVMQDDLKAKIKSDLDLFVKSKQYYCKLGRVWKRSFLLYGPSGTGKSSFIAAIANYLNYDVYEINLSRMKDDAELRSLLLQTTRKSVLVVEDLDRVTGTNLAAGLSLPGLLNFMDGFFNSCVAEERIMVFTMSSKDGVDPGLLRPGRVDVHIYFPLCDFNAFKELASSYLGLKDHKLFPTVEEIFSCGSSLSPAEIGELMIANRSSPSRAIKSVICALQNDGEGRGRFSESGSRRMVEEVDEPDSVLCRYGTPVGKEIKKFYGFMSMRKSRKTMSLDLGSEQHLI